MTSAVKLNRRPPFTTLATRLIATTRSRYAVAGAPPAAPRPSPRRSRRSPPPAPVPRRWAPGITSFLSWWRRTSELQPALARGVSQRGDAAVVAVARPVEDDRIDAGGLRPLGDELADGGRAGLLVAGLAADRALHRRRRDHR